MQHIKIDLAIFYKTGDLRERLNRLGMKEKVAAQ